MLVGLTEQMSPVAGEIAVVRPTVPVKPLSGMTITVVETGTPGVVLRIAELGNIWKSTTWTDTVAVWGSDPLVPVTVTV